MPDVISRQEAKSLGLKRYYTGIPCKRGHLAERSVLGHRCVECNTFLCRGWQQKTGAVRSRQHREQNQALMMWRRARSRARKKGLAFTLSVADIVIPEVCPATGLRLEMSVGSGGSWNSPSLDRLDSTRGYEPDNIIVVSNLANTIKHDATPDQILAVGNFYKQLFEARAA